ncbi:MAG: ComEA family DNA-binding protein [Flavobacteriaceae bacterium]
MTDFKSHFKFNKQEQSGIFFLLLLIFIFQAVLFFMNGDTFAARPQTLAIDEKTQMEINKLKRIQEKENKAKLYPFNPNYINDFKGYTLGMSPEEIDKLLGYRAKGNFVNSAEEFQQITGISDSLLLRLVPYFKFPDLPGKKHRQLAVSNTQPKRVKMRDHDLNTATAEELREIRGVGEVLSARIIKFRDALGGFLIEDQLYDVYGLEDEVAGRLIKNFGLASKPKVEKINLNKASAHELAALVYINHNLAEKIVAYRTQIGAFQSFDEFAEIADFPKDKIDRIKLYLSL